MKSLHIKSTLNSPEINFNLDTCEFSIEGQSILTEVQDFYAPIIAWLDKFSENPSKTLVFKFALNYYNLSSAKRFMFIIYLLSKIKMRGCEVQIIWRFFKDDEFMKEFGEDLSENFDVPLSMEASKNYVPAIQMAS